MVKLTLNSADLVSERTTEKGEFIVYASLVSNNYQDLLSQESPLIQTEEFEGVEIVLVNEIEDSSRFLAPGIRLVGYSSIELTTGSVMFILKIIGERKEVQSLQDIVFELEIDPVRVEYLNIRELLNR